MLYLKILFNNFLDSVNHFIRFKFDLQLKKLLEKKYKPGKEFFILQVGANDGKSFDFLYSFIKERNTRGVMIEPIKEYFELLKNNFKNIDGIKLVNKAVHPTLHEVMLYKVNSNYNSLLPEWSKGIASLDPEHHKKSGIDSEYIVSETTSAETLMNIVAINYEWNKIDLLQIDVEGYDYQVLKMFDFSVIKPRFIKLEICNLSKEDLTETYSILKKNRYHFFKEGNDLIALSYDS